jgi:hypothetical protein
MGGSGIDWIDTVFRYCVVLLVDIAKILGISYEELNIWVFVVLMPGLIILSLMLNIYLLRRLKRIKKGAR